MFVEMCSGLLSREAGKQQDKPCPQPPAVYCKQHLGLSYLFVPRRPIPLGSKIWLSTVQKQERTDFFFFNMLLLANLL